MASERILVVDDDKNLLEVIKIRLESADYEVATALDEDSAIKMAQEQLFDLAVLDLQLVQMDGIKLSWDGKVLDYIVQKAIEFKLGARGLRSICEAIMMDAMFELPSKENASDITIGIKYAREKLEKANMKRLRAA